MIKEGLVSPPYKVVAALSRTSSPATSNYSLESSSPAFMSTEREHRKFLLVRPVTLLNPMLTLIKGATTLMLPQLHAYPHKQTIVSMIIAKNA
jgi:hypothetical protein